MNEFLKISFRQILPFSHTWKAIYEGTGEHQSSKTKQAEINTWCILMPRDNRGSRVWCWTSMALKWRISSLKSTSFKFVQENRGKEVKKGKNTEGGKKPPKNPKNKKGKKICNINWFFCLNIKSWASYLSCCWNCRTVTDSKNSYILHCRHLTTSTVL